MTGFEYKIETVEELDQLREGEDDEITTPFSILAEYPGIDDETRQRALDFLNEWQGWQYGHSPRTAAAMAIYYANMTKQEWTQEKVSNLFDVNTTSMRHLWDKAQEDLSTETLRDLEIGHYS